jgi:imidazole glycerol phosphate synthase subunit HisF
MEEKMMLQVEKFLKEVGFFIEKTEAEFIVINIISGWTIPENSKDIYPFLKLDNVHINTGAVTLADVVESNIDTVRSGKDVVVILADNRQQKTKMEFFKCNIPTDSALTPSQIVGKANVNFFEGQSYYDEEIL